MVSGNDLLHVLVCSDGRCGGFAQFEKRLTTWLPWVGIGAVYAAAQLAARLKVCNEYICNACTV